MLVFKNCLVGPPCATGLSGRADGCGGIDPGLVALEPAGGVATAGAIEERCSGCVSTAGLTEAETCGGGLGSVGSACWMLLRDVWTLMSVEVVYEMETNTMHLYWHFLLHLNVSIGTIGTIFYLVRHGVRCVGVGVCFGCKSSNAQLKSRSRDLLEKARKRVSRLGMQGRATTSPSLKSLKS